ncbi:MAG: Transposase mutator type, partial [Acetothermia bacterium 64_32]
MRDKTREEILKELEERIKAMVKGLLERLMVEERAMYLEKNPTKANGYYTGDLLTLVGPVKDLRVPRVREGDFHPKILFLRRTSLELSEAILALYA